MSERDIHNLWEAVDALRHGQGELLVAVGRIEARLAERCAERAKRLDSLNADIAEAQKRLEAVERGQSRLAAASSVLASLGVLAGQWLFRLWGRS
ncbi:hypothetical protein [Desulfohalovibrio reitneri]|uniref:hypothetical protein n=1 Tax=Desulfohalovibrio reitneri TaxID=1307759 RepID=UPI0004A6BA16|nr:hypothetical protein [Desulfohalovibrio reitneri]